MDRAVGRGMVHWVTNGWTRLSDLARTRAFSFTDKETKAPLPAASDSRMSHRKFSAPRHGSLGFLPREHSGRTEALPQGCLFQARAPHRLPRLQGWHDPHCEGGRQARVQDEQEGGCGGCDHRGDSAHGDYGHRGLRGNTPRPPDL